jgi:hypothetical protein
MSKGSIGGSEAPIIFTRPNVVLLVFLWLGIHICLVFYYGARPLGDALGYVQGGDFLLASGGIPDNLHSFYVVYLGLVAVFRYIFPGDTLPVIIFQSLVSFLATLCLYKTSAKLFHNRTAGLSAALIFLLSWDYIHWNVVTMTESLACSTICFLILILYEFKPTKRNYILISALLIISLFIRPTGVLIILGTIAFMMKYHQGYFKDHPAMKWLLITTVIVLCFVGAALMFYIWDFTDQYARGNIVTYVDNLSNNELDRSLRIKPSDVELLKSTGHPMIKIIRYVLRNPFEFLKTASLKVMYLLSGVRPYYSRLHNIYVALWMTGIYVSFFLGLKRLTPQPVLYFVITVIIANCLLIGISSVDWDNRFYVPMEPGIVLICGGGIVSIKDWLSKRFNRKISEPS